MARVPSRPIKHYRVSSRRIGERYENLALSYLTQAGLTLLERNASCRSGELDLIMQHNTTIVFIEVRYRRNLTFGCAATSVTKHKQKRIILAATYWLTNKKLSFNNTDCRFDVFAITGEHVEWIVDAFNGDITSE